MLREIDPVTAGNLVVRAQNGDRAALERLFREYLPYLKRLCLRIGGDEAVAADSLQEVALALLDHLGALKDPRMFKYWISSVAVNACRMELRRRGRSSKRFVPLDSKGAETGIEEAGEKETAEDRLIERDLVEKAWTMLGRLPEEQRVIFILCDVEQLPYAEAAQVLGGNAESIRSKARRARSAVGRLLADDSVMLEALNG